MGGHDAACVQVDEERGPWQLKGSSGLTDQKNLANPAVVPLVVIQEASDKIQVDPGRIADEAAHAAVVRDAVAAEEVQSRFADPEDWRPRMLAQQHLSTIDKVGVVHVGGGEYRLVGSAVP